MRLAIVYDPLDNKMREDTYSFVYRGMFDALVEHFSPIVHVTSDCSAADIEADVILFWDVNSCHHVTIDGIERHPALKLEYMSDPFQREVRGVYQRYQMPVWKLGAEQRLSRALARGVSRIICPTRKGFERYFAPVLGDERAERMLLFHPPAPWFSPGTLPLAARNLEVLANGSTGSVAGGAYDFRTWAHGRPGVSLVPHWISQRSTPMGRDYGEFLKRFAAGLALCDIYPVVKYFEMPLAGCVTFMQHHEELEDLGFRDMESCVFVNRENFDQRISDFLSAPLSYQRIAGAGRKVMENYTARRFAAFVESAVAKTLNPSLEKPCAQSQ